MEKLFGIAIMICIALFGLFKLFRDNKKVKSKLAFAQSYLIKLQEYVSSRGNDIQAYTFLLNRSNKMQNLMGSQGIIHGYKPPYQNIMYKEYAIILNMVPELRKSLEDNILSTRLAGQFADALQEALVRHIGGVEDSLAILKADFKNPFVWIREGVRGLLALPGFMLGWLGLISEKAAHRIYSSIIFRIISGIFALVGFISAVVTIILGWDEIVVVIHTFCS